MGGGGGGGGWDEGAAPMPPRTRLARVSVFNQFQLTQNFRVNPIGSWKQACLHWVGSKVWGWGLARGTADKRLRISLTSRAECFFHGPPSDSFLQGNIWFVSPQVHRHSESSLLGIVFGETAEFFLLGTGKWLLSPPRVWRRVRTGRLRTVGLWLLWAIVVCEAINRSRYKFLLLSTSFCHVTSYYCGDSIFDVTKESNEQVAAGST